MPLIANRYELLDRIGSGAMGDVYRATDTQSGQTVAVKALKPDLVTANPDLLVRFQREGEALRELNHPNIVTLLDVVGEGDAHYLVMEYVSGGDLAALLTDSPNGLPIDQLLNIALDLADALTRAHRLDIIHRDLKPANILIAEDGTPRLSDFGIARYGDADSLTDSSSLLGTLFYLAPEACLGQPIDHRADIWAFGVVLFEMLTGRRPFPGETAGSIINSILNSPFPDPQELRPDTSADLSDLLYRMLEKDSNGRIPSVRLVGAELESMLKGTEYAASLPPAHSDTMPVSVFSITTPTTGKGRHNLPAQGTSFVGREGELAHVSDLLTDPAKRLVTILGPGGMGKSRLSIETGGRLTTQFPDGVFFVELAKLDDPENIPIAIGEAAGYPFSGDATPRQQILQFLGNKHLLLILDNFEHLLDGASLVSDIIRGAPDVTILATSRTRLNLSGETIFNLDPMDYPEWETPEDALRYSAVQLFMQSARRIQLDFALQQDDLTYLTRICQLVEGIPLGILLAAAWVDVLSLAEIAAEIADNLDFLESEMADLPERQRSMRAAIDYSWRLLSEEEREAFARMSVFRGGCTRKAAQAVSGTSIRMLTALVNKSFLRRDQETGRFEIHELLRQFAAEHLEAQGQPDAIRDAHMNYYLPALAAKEADLKGADQLTALDDIEIDFENVRAAWMRAIERGNLADLQAAIIPLAIYCDLRSRIAPANAMMDAVRNALEGRDDLEGRLLWAWAVVQRDMVRTPGRLLVDNYPDYQTALDLARTTGDRLLEGCALYLIAWVKNAGAEYDEAVVLLEESTAVFEAANDLYYQALALHITAVILIDTAELEVGRPYLDKTVAIRRAIGDRANLAKSVNNLGVFAARQGHTDAKRGYYQEAIELARSMGTLGSAAFTQGNLAMDYLFSGQIEEGRQILQEAMVIARQINDPNIMDQIVRGFGLLALIDEDYDRAESLADEALALTGGVTILSKAQNLGIKTEAAFGRDDYELAAERLDYMMRELPPVNISMKAIRLQFKARFYAQAGDYERAAELLGIFHGVPGHAPIEDMPYAHYQHFVTRVKDALGQDGFEAAFARGEAMDIDQEFAREFAEYLDADDS